MDNRCTPCVQVNTTLKARASRPPAPPPRSVKPKLEKQGKRNLNGECQLKSSSTQPLTYEIKRGEERPSGGRSVRNAPSSAQPHECLRTMFDQPNLFQNSKAEKVEGTQQGDKGETSRSSGGVATHNTKLPSYGIQWQDIANEAKTLVRGRKGSPSKTPSLVEGVPESSSQTKFPFGLNTDTEGKDISKAMRAALTVSCHITPNTASSTTGFPDYCAVGDTFRHQFDSSQSETQETTIHVSLPNVFSAFTQTRISSFLKILFRQDKTRQVLFFISAKIIIYINYSTVIMIDEG